MTGHRNFTQKIGFLKTPKKLRSYFERIAGISLVTYFETPNSILILSFRICPKVGGLHTSEVLMLHRIPIKYRFQCWLHSKPLIRIQNRSFVDSNWPAAELAVDSPTIVGHDSPEMGQQ